MERLHFARNTFYSMVGFGFLIISNIVYNAVVGRMLGPTYYAVFSSFLVFLLGFNQPINSFQLAVAKYTEENGFHKRTALRKVTPTLMLFAGAFLLIFILLSPVIKDFLHLDDIWDVIIGGLVLCVWLILAGYRGVSQGRLDFFHYGLNIGLEGVFRAIIGVGLLLLGLHIKGAIGASIVSGIIAIFILLFGYIRYYFRHAPTFRFRINKKLALEFLNALLVLLPFGLIMGLDLNMVSGKGDIGGYLSACGVIGKNLIMLSLVVANVVYSYALKRLEKTFWIGISLTCATFLAAFVFVLIFGEWVVNLIWARDYLEAVQYLPLYVLFSLPMGIMQNIVSFSIVKNSFWVKILLWLFLPLLVAIYHFTLQSYDLMTFLWIGMGVLFAMDVLLLLAVLIGTKNKKTLDNNQKSLTI